MAEFAKDVPIRIGLRLETAGDLSSSRFLDEIHELCKVDEVPALKQVARGVLKSAAEFGLYGLVIGGVTGTAAGALPGAALGAFGGAAGGAFAGVAYGLEVSVREITEQEQSCRSKLMEDAIRKQQGDKK